MQAHYTDSFTLLIILNYFIDQCFPVLNFHFNSRKMNSMNIRTLRIDLVLFVILFFSAGQRLRMENYFIMSDSCTLLVLMTILNKILK